MSQNRTIQNENSVSLVRVSIGSGYPILWSDEDPFQIKNTDELEVVCLEKSFQANDLSEINRARTEAINSAHNEWIWLVDADVIPTEEFYVSLSELLDSSNAQEIFGGLYSSISSQSLWERSYNRLCNIWSQAHGVPLAGNMIFHRNFIPHIQELKNRAFGSEEYFLNEIARIKNFSPKVLATALHHANGKTLKTLFATCRSQAQTPSPRAPKFRYLKLLAKSLPEAPLETAVAAAYFLTSAFLSLLSPKSKSHSPEHRKRSQTP